MLEQLVTIMLIIVALYLLAGILFSVFFLARGLKVIDEGVHGSSIGFKIIIMPGIIVFWPALLLKWIKAEKQLKLSNLRRMDNIPMP